MVMIDLAVPKTLSLKPAVSTTYTYIRWLGRLVRSGAAARRAAVIQAEAIIETRVQGFMQWLQAREVVPVICGLHQAAEDMRLAELERARRLLARGDAPEAVLEQLAHGLTQKYLHGPLTALNRSGGDERKQLLAWMPRLFPGRDARR